MSRIDRATQGGSVRDLSDQGAAVNFRSCFVSAFCSACFFCSLS
jgi:hypothetical protein